MQDVYTDYEPTREATTVEQNYMYEWFFHYNPNTMLWNAVPRSAIGEYFNNYNHPDILRAKHLNILLDMIHRTEGDAKLIKEINSDDVK